MSEWLDKHRDGARILSEVSRDLYGLSRALSRVGNDKMAEDIGGFCIRIDLANKMMDEAVSENIDSRLRDAKASSKAIIEAALAGIEIAGDTSSD